MFFWQMGVFWQKLEVNAGFWGEKHNKSESYNQGLLQIVINVGWLLSAQNLIMWCGGAWLSEIWICVVSWRLLLGTKDSPALGFFLFTNKFSSHRPVIILFNLFAAWRDRREQAIFDHVNRHVYQGDPPTVPLYVRVLKHIWQSSSTFLSKLRRCRLTWQVFSWIGNWLKKTQ